MNLLYVLENATEAPTGGSILPTILMLVAVVAVFFFMSRSQKKQEREANNMRNSLMMGDEITTIGGIIGRVVKVTEETVVIETSKDRTKLHILKSAIRSVDVHAADTVEAAEKAEKQAAKNEEKTEK
jgi:preprotein translocase subunit YajC